MIVIEWKKILARVAVVLGFELILILGLFLSLNHQSRGIGVAVEGQSIFTNDLIDNPSFEDPHSDKLCYNGSAPHSWRCWRSNPDIFLKWVWGPTNTHSGNYTVLIDTNYDNDSAFWQSDYFRVYTNQQYTFSGWIRVPFLAPGAYANLRLKYFDVNKNYLGKDDSNYIRDSTIGWALVEGSGRPRRGSEWWGRLGAELHGRGTAYFDDLAASEVTPRAFLVLDGIAEPTPVLPMGTLTYAITLTNAGSITATSGRLTNTLDPRLMPIGLNTSPTLTCTPDGQTVICLFSGLPSDSSISETLFVSVLETIDVNNPLVSSFEVSAMGVESKRHVIETPIIDFELSRCGTGIAAPGIALDYVHNITNTSDYSLTFATAARVVPDDCGTVATRPKDRNPIAPSKSVSVTLFFTPSDQLKLPAVCFPKLDVEAEGSYEKISQCKTFVISDWLALDLFSRPSLVLPGENVTFTLSYTYVGGINANDIRITFTLDGPAVISPSMPSADDRISDTMQVWLPPAKSVGGTGKITITAIPSFPGFVTGTAQVATRYAGPIRKSTTIEVMGYEIYLPLIISRWPPIPELYSIDNADGNDSFDVCWSTIDPVTNYILEEATTSDFTDAVEVYSDSDTCHSVSAKGPGRYYYRVIACNVWGCSPWSNVEWVDVQWEREPNSSCSEANGPLISGIDYYGYLNDPPTDQWDVFKLHLDVGDSIRMKLDIDIDTDGEPQLLLYSRSGSLVCRDWESPFDLTCTAPATDWYCIAIYTPLVSNNSTPYTLWATFP